MLLTIFPSFALRTNYSNKIYPFEKKATQFAVLFMLVHIKFAFGQIKKFLILLPTVHAEYKCAPTFPPNIMTITTYRQPFLYI